MIGLRGKTYDDYYDHGDADRDINCIFFRSADPSTPRGMNLGSAYRARVA